MLPGTVLSKAVFRIRVLLPRSGNPVTDPKNWLSVDNVAVGYRYVAIGEDAIGVAADTCAAVLRLELWGLSWCHKYCCCGCCFFSVAVSDLPEELLRLGMLIKMLFLYSMC